MFHWVSGRAPGVGQARPGLEGGRMKYLNKAWAVVVTVAFAAAPLGAQQPSLVVSGMGGGYSPLGTFDGTHFNRGFTLGGCLGVELTNTLALHADVTWMRSIAHGPVPFSGTEVSRYFYGGHVEFRAPFERGVVPFGFVGVGAVTIVPGPVSQQGLGGIERGGFPPSAMVYSLGASEHQLTEAFTKPAASFGGGLFYLRIPGAPIELFLEGKALVYHWDRAGYNKTQVDMTYALGMSYRAMLLR